MRCFLNKFAVLEKQRGGALLNVVVVSAMLGGMIFVMNERLGNHMKLAKRYNVATYRDQIGRLLLNAIKDPYALQTTRLHSLDFRRCVEENLPSRTADCNACSEAMVKSTAGTASAGACWRNINLFMDNVGSPSDSDTGDDVKIGGGGPSGPWYSTKGDRGCNPNTDPENCAFVTEVQYAPVCPKRQRPNGTWVAETSCDRADYFLFRYKVYDNRPASLNLVNNIGFGQTPPAREYLDAEYATKILTSAIQGDDQCPVGSIAHGFGSNQKLYYNSTTQFRGVGDAADGVNTRGEVHCKCEWESSRLLTAKGREAMRQLLRYNDRGQPYNCEDLYTQFVKNQLRDQTAESCPRGFRADGYAYEANRLTNQYVRKPKCVATSYDSSRGRIGEEGVTRIIPVGAGDRWYRCSNIAGQYSYDGRAQVDPAGRVAYLRVVDCYLNSSDRVVCNDAQAACGYRMRERQ